MRNKTIIPQRPKYSQLFLIILSIYTAIFIVYQIFAICSLNSSQDKIKNYYLDHIEKVDSLYYNLGINNKAILSTYMQDSIYNKDMELLYMEYEKVLKEDSLRLYNERSLVEMQTKSMIDLHLDKVEHEYSNLTIWAAILTILFLVFSFYSIYKMDELIQQGNDGVKDIRRLKKDSERLIGNLETTSKLEINKTRSQIDNFIKEQQDRMIQTLSYFEGESTNKLSEINKCFVDACNIMEQIKHVKDTIENNQSKK
ncbi:MAG: hypothetical protein IAC08_01965 [Bacteroidetes bacterium]|uniref:Uncharacterized protein n=1 Tax=Candidatus Cryptobacteroides intestinigallinarum TaxID=2840767 RepID=A0A9D9HJU7_9BACT|nr:hypothetical protein [Candidatus Cryptobacteroides intestinigallinarum]